MRRLIFLLEEPSAEEMLKGILPLLSCVTRIQVIAVI